MKSAEKPVRWVVLGSKLDFAGDGLSGHRFDKRQRQIDAGGYAGRSPDVAVVYDALLTGLRPLQGPAPERDHLPGADQVQFLQAGKNKKSEVHKADEVGVKGKVKGNGEDWKDVGDVGDGEDGEEKSGSEGVGD